MSRIATTTMLGTAPVSVEMLGTMPASVEMLGTAPISIEITINDETFQIPKTSLLKMNLFADMDFFKDSTPAKIFIDGVSKNDVIEYINNLHNPNLIFLEPTETGIKKFASLCRISTYFVHHVNFCVCSYEILDAIKMFESILSYQDIDAIKFAALQRFNCALKDFEAIPLQLKDRANVVCTSLSDCFELFDMIQNMREKYIILHNMSIDFDSVHFDSTTFNKSIDIMVNLIKIICVSYNKNMYKHIFKKIFCCNNISKMFFRIINKYNMIMDMNSVVIRLKSFMRSMSLNVEVKFLNNKIGQIKFNDVTIDDIGIKFGLKEIQEIIGEFIADEVYNKYNNYNN